MGNLNQVVTFRLGMSHPQSLWEVGTPDIASPSVAHGRRCRDPATREAEYTRARRYCVTLDAIDVAPAKWCR